jgi:MFS family permease
MSLSDVDTQAPPVVARPAFGTVGQVTLQAAAALTAIDAFIVNVALPSIQQTFRVPASTSQFVVSLYGIVYAVLLVFAGRLGDRFGRRRILLMGITGFTVASLVCGLAPDIEMLIAARVAQGAAAAFLLPQVLSTIQAALTDPARTRAVSYYGAIGGLSIAIGQLLGGVFVWADLAGLGWRPIFLVNVPVGIVALIGIRLRVPETRTATPPRADLGGTALFGAAVLALLVPLSLGRQAHWPLWTWAMMLLAIALGAVLWRYEQRVERGGAAPLLAPSLFRSSAVRRGLLILAAGFLAFGGFVFVLSLALQIGNGMSAWESGLSMAPMAAGQLFAAMRAPKLIAKIGVRTLRIGGLIHVGGMLCTIVAVLLWWPHLRFFELTIGMLLLGAGNGLYVPAVFRAVLSSIPPDQVGLGSGIVNTTQRTAVALGVAVLGAVYVGVSGRGDPRVGFLAVCAVFLAVAAMYAALGGLLRTDRKTS